MEMKGNFKYRKIWRILVCVMFFNFQFSIFNLLSSCSGEYIGVPRAEVLRYQTVPTYGALYDLAAAYGRSLNSALKADTLHPGMYAEYGVTLALMGHDGTACRMLNAEVKAFPESRGMIYRIKQRLLPDFLGDTLTSTHDSANLEQLASWAYDSITALKPLPPVAPVIDSTDSVWISQQTPVDSISYPIRLTANQKRELLEQQQAEEAARQQHVADSIAAAKQAVIDARKQAQLDREQEKKAKEEARKVEQKAREQQREEKRKQKAAQREEERKRKAAEREEAKKKKKKEN
jgi:hypothetical protein